MEWSISAMIAVEPVSRKAITLAAPITKSTNSATATARVLVVMGALYHLGFEMFGGRLIVRTVLVMSYPGSWNTRRRSR